MRTETPPNDQSNHDKTFNPQDINSNATVTGKTVVFKASGKVIPIVSYCLHQRHRQSAQGRFSQPHGRIDPLPRIKGNTLWQCGTDHAGIAQRSLNTTNAQGKTRQTSDAMPLSKRFGTKEHVLSWPKRRRSPRLGASLYHGRRFIPCVTEVFVKLHEEDDYGQRR